MSGRVSVGSARSSAGSTVDSLLCAAAESYAVKRGASRRGSRPPSSGSEASPSGGQARADAAFAHSADLVMFVGLDGTIDSASAACRQMLGVEPEALVGLNSFDLIHPDDQARVLVALSSIPNLGDQVRVEFRVIDGTGRDLWLEEIATNLVDDPDVGCVVSSLRDVTERVELLRRIETDRRRLAVAQASAKLGSVELNLDTGEVRQSDELCRMLGLEPGAEPGTDFEFVHADDRDRIREVVAETLAGRSQPECTFRIVRVDGEVRWVLAQATTLGTPDANVVVATMLDITDRYQAELALAHQATHDWLTHLPNAPSLHNSLQSALSDADPSHLVAVALVDIDHFKLVNDRGGHALGDQVLRAVAARLKAELPSSDIVARVGGDEFVIVRAGVSTLDAAKELGVSAMALLREPVTVIDREVQLTISVGVALSTAADSPDSLLRDVDDAMCQAKRDGKNRITVFDHGARVRAHRRQSVAAALPLALARDELHLEYQPIVNVATVETAGFEALLRWEHPDFGTIAPDEFIPIAEANGLILPIGAWVLERASQQLADWRADQQVPPELWIAINLSASQLAQPNLASQVQATIRRAGVPAAAIHLEIAENVLMDRIDNALNTIVELQAVGVSVSIDDFGTGYSSLSYLSRLPVDTIKIDRSFVSGLGGAGHGTSIIRATIALANTLNLHVVAEGVELPAQLDLLRELGCTYGQGFIWSRSLRPEAALKWMTEHTAALPPPNPGQLAARRTAIANAPVDVGQAIVAIAHTSGGRRRTPADLANILRFDSLEIGLNARKAWLAGRDLDLTVKEFDLLAFLTEHTGQVFSRTELLHEVWHSSPDWQNPATVTEHIHRLRSRIEPDPSRPRLISTVRGRGYCFGSEAVGISTYTEGKPRSGQRVG